MCHCRKRFCRAVSGVSSAAVHLLDRVEQRHAAFRLARGDHLVLEGPHLLHDHLIRIPQLRLRLAIVLDRRTVRVEEHDFTRTRLALANVARVAVRQARGDAILVAQLPHRIHLLRADFARSEHFDLVVRAATVNPVAADVESIRIRVQPAADAIATLQDGHGDALLLEQSSAAKAGGAGTNDDHALYGARLQHGRFDAAEDALPHVFIDLAVRLFLRLLGMRLLLCLCSWR